MSHLVFNFLYVRVRRIFIVSHRIWEFYDRGGRTFFSARGLGGDSMNFCLSRFVFCRGLGRCERRIVPFMPRRRQAVTSGLQKPEAYPKLTANGLSCYLL